MCLNPFLCFHVRMETGGTGAIFSYVVIALFVAIIALVVGSVMSSQGNQMSGFQDVPPPKDAVEGFAGPAVGAGMPDCLRTSKDAAALYELVSSKRATTEEGPDDLREMKLILSKISCFKKDLLGVARVVEATRYQPFSTSHDLEPVAETCARCFSRTIPQRDLSLSLNKWGSRGTLLIKRLCTSENLSDAEEKEALRLFGKAMGDLSDIAAGQCCESGDVKIGGREGPRQVGGFLSQLTQSLQEYKGYF